MRKVNVERYLRWSWFALLGAVGFEYCHDTKGKKSLPPTYMRLLVWNQEARSISPPLRLGCCDQISGDVALSLT